MNAREQARENVREFMGMRMDGISDAASDVWVPIVAPFAADHVQYRCSNSHWVTSTRTDLAGTDCTAEFSEGRCQGVVGDPMISVDGDDIARAREALGETTKEEQR